MSAMARGTRESVAEPSSSGLQPIRTSSLSRWRQRQAQREKKRMSVAMAVSLILHVALLAVTFDQAGIGLPGATLRGAPGQASVPDLTVVLTTPAPAASQPADGPSQPRNDSLVVAAIASPGTSAEEGRELRIPARVSAGQAQPRSREPAPSRPQVANKPSPRSPAKARAVRGAAPRPAIEARATPPPAPAVAPRGSPVVAVVAPDPEALLVPPSVAASAPEPSASSPEEVEKAARAEAALERARVAERARIERELRDSEERQAQEAARQEAARQETARRETARQETARQETARQETARQEAAKQEAARQVAARQAAEEAERSQVASRERASAQAEADGRAGQREPGRAGGPAGGTRGQEPGGKSNPLDGPGGSGAIQGAPTRTPLPGTNPELQVAPRSENSKAPPSGGQRRRTLLGRADQNVVLVMYAEGWRQRIEMNPSVELLREAKKQPHGDPVVSVALRNDGSVESVTFNRSSGVPELDDAIRNAVNKLAPYPPFPPDLAREYDVVEIRRVWTLDTAIRLFAGGR